MHAMRLTGGILDHEDRELPVGFASHEELVLSCADAQHLEAASGGERLRALFRPLQQWRDHRRMPRRDSRRHRTTNHEPVPVSDHDPLYAVHKAQTLQSLLDQRLSAHVDVLIHTGGPTNGLR
eukprot:CAMPEP_0181217232 /NCGR_PEP_ID=MMETSP1096-20121128/27037_1 /TAXON_ID=156174 ORGANISM="Chrysochromulina ericina, Strain CCMP281" /NCGR_SAMPLE_ID=MMETSP1096 /ASSEMBLY_ACC=CAM_ASM_000453 /LENGTH=122 /DNA_ID=CAMNT_0023309341 /DNA_START=499 /DNA_END=867 /DNA_ORIENTATION=+